MSGTATTDRPRRAPGSRRRRRTAFGQRHSPASAPSTSRTRAWRFLSLRQLQGASCRLPVVSTGAGAEAQGRIFRPGGRTHPEPSRRSGPRGRASRSGASAVRHPSGKRPVSRLPWHRSRHLAEQAAVRQPSSTKPSIFGLLPSGTEVGSNAYRAGGGNDAPLRTQNQVGNGHGRRSGLGACNRIRTKAAVHERLPEPTSRLRKRLGRLVVPRR